jgi:hypothetical protein
MLLAWNGRASDCSKLFELTEVEYWGLLFMPDNVEYFSDSIVPIKAYRRIVFNKSKHAIRTLLGYGFGTIFELAFGKTLQDAHNSLIDAHAQARIFANPQIQVDFDRTQCVVELNSVWSGKKKRGAEYTMEPTRTVPFSWTDQGTDITHIPQSMRYLGPNGSGVVSPSTSLTRACSN